MKRRIFAVLLVLILSLATTFTRATSVGSNVDITASSDPNNRQQVEPTIAVHPLKPSIIVAGAQDLRLGGAGNRWHGYYRSTDGGQTWSVSLLPGFPGDNSREGMASPLRGCGITTDPNMAFDRHGNVYYAGAAISCPFAFQTIFVAKYVNDGAQYAFTTTVEGFEKDWIAVDNSGGSHDGNVYIISLGGGFKRSTDSGQTFSRSVALAGAGGPTGVTVDPQGNVFVVSVDFSISQILVSKSTEGGLRFQKAVVSATVAPIPKLLPGNKFRTGTIPQIAADADGAYVVWDDFRTGDANVLLTRSLDGGNTWSAPTQVSDVTASHQFFPTIAALGGSVSVAWYDSRLSQLPNGTIVGLDVFLTGSTNNAASFSPSVRVTTTSFNPNIVGRTEGEPFIGDYIHIAATSTKVHPVWADNRNVNLSADANTGLLDQDVFTAIVVLSAGGGGGGRYYKV